MIQFDAEEGHPADLLLWYQAKHVIMTGTSAEKNGSNVGREAKRNPGSL